MNEVAAFKAQYVDWKMIKTRSVVQIIFEIDVSQADSAYQALGGMPNGERWFGIARLREQPERTVVQDSHANLAQPDKTAPVTASAAPPRASLAQRAGILCNEPAFWKFLCEHNYQAGTAEQAAIALRHYCGCKSRRELDTNEWSAGFFHQLDQSYRAWMKAAEVVPA